MMKHLKWLHILTVFVLCALLVTSLLACTGEGTPAESTSEAEESTSSSTEESTTEEATTEEATTEEATTEEGTTEESTTEAAPEKKTLSTNWNFGYVGSDQHGTVGNRYKIVENGGYYSYTDVFTVEKAGTRITFTDDNTNANGDQYYASNAAFVFSSWKEENGAWVIDQTGANFAGSGSSDSIVAKKTSVGMVYTYITSVDNEHLRVCFRSGQTASFTPAAFPDIYLEETNEPGTLASQNQETAAFEQWFVDSKASSYFEKLEGKKLYAIGDSYFAGNGLNSSYVWPALLAKKYNMTFENDGINGNCLSACTGSSNPMVNRFATDIGMKDPDIILIEGGKNDFNKSAPMGTVDSTDKTTFQGALNVLLNTVQEKYPNALIICVTAWNVNQTNRAGYTVNDYGNAMKAVCAKRNIPCFDATDTAATKVNMNSETFRAEYCMSSTDVSHLNLKGHQLVFPAFESFIAAEWEKKPETPPLPEIIYGEKVAMTIVWHFGYVKSTGAIVDEGKYYSYTDVITVPKAGTRITFVDDNTNANGDKGFASASAYVVSSWKQDKTGNWVFDADGTNYAGAGAASNVVASYENGVIVYTYITQKDNEHIRLCFRSGQTSTFTPPAFPTVYSEVRLEK